MMNKFKVGDKVVAIGEVAGFLFTGFRGTVVNIVSGSPSYPIGVEFENRLGTRGHSCNGHGKSGHCRFGTEDEFKHAYRDWDE